MKKIIELLKKEGFCEDTIRYGLTHTHLQSPQDTGSLMKDFFIRMKELHCPVVFVSEHGVMTSLYDAIALGKKYDIRVVPGVEAYLEDELGKRSHFILYAMNEQGFSDLKKIVTESFKNVEKVGKLVFPYTSMELLKKYSGNIIATSACINGPLANILSTNELVEEKIAKLKNKAGSNPCNIAYEKDKNAIEELGEKITSLRQKKTKLQNELKKKSFSGNREEVEKEVENLTTQILTASATVSKLKKGVKKTEEEIEKYESILSEIDTLSKKLADKDTLYQMAAKKAKEFEQIFGKGKFFIELQYHGIEKEKMIYPILAEIAKEEGIPVVAANDVHIATNSKEDFERRQIMASTKFNQWSETNVGDDQLYIKSDFELALALSEIIPEDMVINAIKNIGYLAKKCDVTYDITDEHYPKYPLPEGKSAEIYLEELVRSRISELFTKEEWTEEYEKRICYELSIINKMGFADYHLIVADFLEVGRKLGKMPKERFEHLKETMKDISLEDMMAYIEEDQSENGMFIGPGRGSAAGSLVCYALRITDLDPVKYGLLFERFLNPERVSMPDIDSDIATEARDVLIEYVRKKFGENAVCCIVTKGLAQARGAIRAYARVKESIKENKIYLNKGDEVAKKIPKDAKSIGDCVDELRETFKGDALALEIIEKGQLIEGQLMNFGMHAAGVIISDNENVGDYVPLMWDTKNQVWKCQCDMVQAEELKLLKMDFLGLRTLSIITETARRVEMRYGNRIDLTKIPVEKEVFSQIYAKGKTNAVFQFESSGMKQMLMQFQPQSFEDIVLLVAAYRPGPMSFIPGIIESKMQGKKPEYCIPEMGNVLDVTYGYPIYQEQLMDIFHKFAGFTLGESDVIRRYMSKKKVDKFMSAKPKFIQGLVDNGAKKEKAEKLWDELEDFAKYAFNKSHAAAYAMVSYLTAYLKYHYPEEFVVANLNSYDDPKKLKKKIPGLIADLPKGVKLLPPDINRSEKGFSISEDGNILFGLGNIKSVGSSAALTVANRPYTSFKDFIKRGHVKKNATEALIRAGALDSFCSSRKAMLEKVEPLVVLLKEVKEKEEKEAELNKKTEILQIAKEPLKELAQNGCEYKRIPKKSDIEKQLAQAKEAKLQAENVFAKEMLAITREDKKQRLDEEKEFLGMYVSESPLDEYKTPHQLGCLNISEVYEGTCRIFGLITDVRIVKRKKDGKEMAFFTLEDKSGSIEVNCFTNEFEKHGDLIADGNVIAIEGQVKEEIVFSPSNDEEADDEEEVIFKITLEKVAQAAPNRSTIVVHFNNIGDYIKNEAYIKETYATEQGHPLIVDIIMEDKLRKSTLTVSDKIIYDEFLFAEML